MHVHKIELPTIYPVACHTDNIGPGSTFVVIRGQAQDGVDYIEAALKKGANHIVLELGQFIKPELVALINECHATLSYVHNARKALAQLSARAHNYPAKKLKIIGITGTKGKTTTSFIIYHILKAAGISAALTTTIHNVIDDHVFPTDLTTRHPDFLHAFFNVCVQENVEYVVMEVAAQALSLYRVYGIAFDAVLFTNFDQEHAEFYSSMEQYFAAKCLLFDQCKPRALRLINADDAWCNRIKNRQKIKSFSFKDPVAQLYAQMIESRVGISFSILDEYDTTIYNSNLAGDFNAYNILGALLIAKHCGVDEQTIKRALQSIPDIPGRMQQITLKNGARCFIDYAHNPSSYSSLLSTLRAMTDQLIVVFGCGGARDPVKRPIMGSIAAHWADSIILTSDNPRQEEPMKIAEDIISGIAEDQHGKVCIELDRERAIKKACALARPEAIVAVLGKGPDHYQIVGTTKTYFNDAEIVEDLGT